MNKFKKGDIVEIINASHPEYFKNLYKLIETVLDIPMPLGKVPKLGDRGIVVCNETTGIGEAKAYSVEFFGYKMPHIDHFPYAEYRLKKVEEPKEVVKKLLEKVGAKNA